MKLRAVTISVADKHGVLSEISKVFADHKVSIATVLQKETKDNIATIVIIIHKVKEKNLMEAVLRLKKLPVVKKICNIIRVGI